MKDRTRIGSVITAAAVMLVLAGSAVAQTGQQQAGPKPAAMTAQQWQAELARGDALDEGYGLGAYADSRDTSAVTASAPQRVVSVAADGFDWGAAGIGAGAAIGLALLTMGMVVIVRQTRRSQLSTPS